jgi:hypothetical protein
MTTDPEAILQIARLAGRAEVFACLGVAEGQPPAALDAAQLQRLQDLLGRRVDRIAGGLLQEAMASDDVTSAAAAIAYLEDRLSFLSGLLTREQQARIRAECARRVAAWG